MVLPRNTLKNQLYDMGGLVELWKRIAVGRAKKKEGVDVIADDGW